MPSTIEQAKEAILKHGGKASKHQISRELKISLDYVNAILGDLRRKGEIAFSDGFYMLTSVKKDAVQDKVRESVIPSPQKQTVRRLRKPRGAKKAKKSKIEKNPFHPLADALGISKSLVRILEKAGYATIESIAEAAVAKLMAEAKLNLRTAAQLINRARGKK